MSWLKSDLLILYLGLLSEIKVNPGLILTFCLYFFFLQHYPLFRKGLSDQVAKGVVIGSIFLAIVMGVLTMCASL